MNAETTVTLGDALDVLIDHRGKTPKKLGGGWSERGIRVVSAKNIKDSQVNDDNLRFVSPALRERWMPIPLRAGDVLLTSEAPLGEVAFISEDVDWCLGQRLFALRGKDGVLDGRFLYYLLQYGPARADMLNRATGTTATGIRQAELVKVPLRLPSFTNQQQIALALGSLDDKVRSNLKQAKLLGELLKARFTEIIGTPNSYIPFETIASFTKGVSYRSADLTNSSNSLVTLKSINRKGGYQARGLKQYAGKFKPAQEIHPGELVVAQTDLTQAADVVGRVVRVPRQVGVETLIASLDLVIVRPRDGVPAEYIYGVMLEESFREHCRARATGTTVLHLGKDALPTFPVPEVSARTQAEFATIARPLLARRDALGREIETLSTMRKALLPGLLSGRLQISDASTQLEAVR